MTRVTDVSEAESLELIGDNLGVNFDGKASKFEISETPLNFFLTSKAYRKQSISVTLSVNDGRHDGSARYSCD